MNILEQAEQILSSEVNKYKTLKECLDYVESLKGLTQHEKETAHNLAFLKSEIERLQVEKLRAVKEKEEAQGEVEALLKKAKEDGEKIIYSSQKDAQIVLEKCEADKAQIEINIKGKTQELVALSKEIEQKLEILSSLNDSIEKAKAQISQILKA